MTLCTSSSKPRIEAQIRPAAASRPGALSTHHRASSHGLLRERVAYISRENLTMKGPHSLLISASPASPASPPSHRTEGPSQKHIPSHQLSPLHAAWRCSGAPGPHRRRGPVRIKPSDPGALDPGAAPQTGPLAWIPESESSWMRSM